MSDKLNETGFDSESKNDSPETVPETPDADKVNYEENDDWQFEAEAPTLSDTIIDNEKYEINIPKEKPVPARETANSYTAAKPESGGNASVKKKSGNTAKFIITAVFVAAVIAALVILGVRYYTVPNSDEKMNPGNVAMTISDTDVSIGMYNYYYTAVSQRYINYAGYYYDIDTSVDYSKQTTTDSEGKSTTWANIFVNDTVSQLQYVTAYYEEAVKNGVELTEKQEETIETQLSSLKETASDSDMSVDEYISETYGDYCGYATLKKMLVQAYTAQNYYQKRYMEEKPTEDEINEYYEEHSDDYSEIPIAYFQIPYDADSQSETLKKAQEYAKQIKSVNDLKKLIPVACADLIQQYVDYGYFEDTDSAAETLAENVETSITRNDTSFTDEGINWLFSDSTKIGECNVFDDEENSAIFVVLKTGESELRDDEVYSVRHILIMPESEEEDSDNENSSDETASEETEYTDEEWAAAEAKANEILDKYNSGDKTEYSFALLAEEYSDDTESTSSGSSGIFGGLCAGTSLGYMVPSFEAWSTDASRQYGDVEIVKSDFGYHIMYFIEDTASYLYDCELAVFSENEEKFVESVDVKKHKKAMSKTTVAKPVASASDDDSDDMDY